MQTPDQLIRYLFDKHSVRGELVQLKQSIADMTQNHQYPTVIADVLGQLVAATSLLTATLKFEGDIAVQIQGDGPVSYIAVNGTHQQALRGVARFQEVPEQGDLKSLFGKGYLVITITPNKGERYQGVVALEQDTISACLEDYFLQSEQLATRIWLFSDPGQTFAAGMLLQQLPAADGSVTESMDHLASLTETMTSKEIFSLPAEEVLYRLYHQEEVKVYPAQAVSFVCGCSREKSLNAIAGLKNEEMEEILTAEGKISVKCEYCLTEYVFNRQDLTELLHSRPH
ncbi:Hsp33 family molecular chaperone HslO [Gayadomonas joobiniege]|uniref:Hsp33 family molecular chaperone HslO n=1 Tax=Gayadomonas joobiniege TaxID=1234606 RepID=UPI000381B723|nr:Hsp33 family molecular chaperone HslO [Gayadomonas joobiniege]